MALRKLGRSHQELGSLALFALEDSAGRQLSDTERRRDFIANLGKGLDESLANASRLHGWRVQALFEALLVELDAVKLVKSEDDGGCYYDDGAPIKLPDYRLVLADGETVLVEVKNVAPGNRDAALPASELERLQQYARLQGLRLLLAHYWTDANLWTLVDPAVLQADGSKMRLPITGALKANELGLLGDCFLATTPPLVFSLRADPDAPAFLSPEGDGDRSAEFTVGEVEFRAAGQRLEDREEIRIAQALMFFGGWEMSKEAEIDRDRLIAINHVFEPLPPPDGQPEAPHRLVGTLSSIYSATFNAVTLNEDGDVTQLRREPDPGALSRLIPQDFFSRQHTLALWRLNFEPGSGPKARDNDDQMDY